MSITELELALANVDELSWARDGKLLAAMTLDESLESCKFSHQRSHIFDRYSKQKPSVEAIPLLRKALADDSPMTVRCAAKSLRKLGPVAIDAVDDLFEAAARTETHSITGAAIYYPRSLPQSYSECIEAIAAIHPGDRRILDFIKMMAGMDNWGPISASLRTLKTIGTPESLALLRRIAAFWLPELNKMQTRVVEQMLAEIENAKAYLRR